MICLLIYYNIFINIFLLKNIIFKLFVELFHTKQPGKKVWIKLDRNVSIQFNTVFENYVSIQKSIKEVKEMD